MNKRWSKPIVAISIIGMLTMSGLPGISAAAGGKAASPAQTTDAQSGGGPTIDAKAAVLMDEQTGQVLLAQNADEPLPPASMAKMMTEYLILDSISQGKIKWDDNVTISEYSAYLTKGGGFSGIAKAAGETYTVKDLFYAVSIYSDNGAAVAIAEHISGSEEKFAQLMNETAQKMGLSKDAHFIDTTGLDRVDLGKYAPASIEGETIVTARDTAMIAFHLLHDHPEILDYSKIPSKKFRPTDTEPMINYNWMLEGNSDNVNFRKYVYPGVDGLKTGHTDNAGYCFTGTAQKGNMRLITVVMNAKQRETSFLETKKLFDYGFTNFEPKQLVAPNSEVDTLKTVPVKKGVQMSVPIVTQSGVSMVVKKGMKDEEVNKEAQSIDPAKIIAPIKKGDVLGTMKVTYNNVSQTVNLVAADDVEKASWLRLLFRAIGHFFGDVFKGIKNLI